MQQVLGNWLPTTMNSSLLLLHLYDAGKPMCSLHPAPRQTPQLQMLATVTISPWLPTMLALSGFPRSHPERHHWNGTGFASLDNSGWCPDPWIHIFGSYLQYGQISLRTPESCYGLAGCQDGYSVCICVTVTTGGWGWGEGISNSKSLFNSKLWIMF